MTHAPLKHLSMALLGIVTLIGVPLLCSGEIILLTEGRVLIPEAPKAFILLLGGMMVLPLVAITIVSASISQFVPQNKDVAFCASFVGLLVWYVVCALFLLRILP